MADFEWNITVIPVFQLYIMLAPKLSYLQGKSSIEKSFAMLCFLGKQKTGLPWTTSVSGASELVELILV